MIEIRSITLTPDTVIVGGSFLVAAEVAYTQSVYTWADLSNMTWTELSEMTWGDLLSYRNPDHRETRRYSGAFTCGQDFTF